MEKIVDTVGCFLESHPGFIGVTIAWMVGLIVGILIGAFDGSEYVDVFNLGLSISALFMSSLLLVAGKKNSTATATQIEELIRVTDARNELLGLEKLSLKEIEERKDEIENAPGT